MSENEVYAIHTPTCQQELLTSLPFKPICIASGHDWVCVGGVDYGKCAFIDFQKASPFESTTRSWSTEVDDLLPLDLDPYSRALSDHQPIYDNGSSQRWNHRIIMKNIGTDIVNGITICKFASGCKDIADDTVAVLSNNDKTVTIYSLTRQTTMKTLNLSIQINHASISPDGELLVAVGDINKVWFYQRIIQRKVSTQPCYDWKEIAAVRLVCTIRNDWCFSTAWSPSGHLCAVASQFGTITIFEASKIREDMDHTDAVLHYMKSSRPTTTDPSRFIPSAPRSMAFSPEPWNLLAWAEDHGRITIVDVRDDFASRQTIYVNINSDKLEREVYATTPSTRLSDAERELIRVRRRGQALLSTDFETTASNALDYRTSVAAHRNPRSTSIHGGGQLLPNSVMSESERELLQLLGIEQARDNVEAQSTTRPYSVSYSNPSLSSDAVYTPPLTFGQYLIARTDSTSNPASWSTPRRQDSFVMPQSISERASRASAAHPSSFTPGLTLPLSASPSRLSDTGANDTEIRDHEAGHQISTSDTADNTPENPAPNLDEHRPRHRYLSNDLLRYSHLRGLERERGTEALSRWRTLIQSNPTQIIESRDLGDTERFYREHARNWGRRINELRERASQQQQQQPREARTGSAFAHDDMTYIDDIQNDIMLGPETISRMRATVQRRSTIDEVDIQGIGWSWDGRYL